MQIQDVDAAMKELVGSDQIMVRVLKGLSTLQMVVLACIIHHQITDHQMRLTLADLK